MSETSKGESQAERSLTRYRDLKKFDEYLIQKYKGPVLGIDEVGMAPLAGPVLAGALILKSFDNMEGVDDCKVLSPEKRVQMYDKILPNVLEFQYAVVSPEEIDLINIHEAGKVARDRSYKAMQAKDIGVVLIDGNIKMFVKGRKSEAVVKADAKSLTVAAASILAKVTRDRMMQELHKTYPQYGWDTNKGYGSRKHLEALKNYGITPHHRRSFRPVRVAHAWRGDLGKMRRPPRINRGVPTTASQEKNGT